MGPHESWTPSPSRPPIASHLEARRDRERRDLFDAQDGVGRQCDELIGRIDDRMSHAVTPWLIMW